MYVECPKCGSRNLRYSRLRNFSERVMATVGIRALRCRDCHRRFVDRTWRLSSLRYARCPKCWRMDLSLWSEATCYVSVRARLMLTLGAKPYRCEYCRVNFTGFRPRLEKFTFHRWRKRQAAQRETAEKAAAAR